MSGEKYLKTLNTREDIIQFFDYLIKDEKANFHPDDNFETYIQLSNGKPSFEKSKAQALNARMQEAKKIAGQDVYALAQASVDKNYSQIKSIGGSINMKPRTMFADGGKMSVTDAVALHNINQWFSNLSEAAVLKVTKCSGLHEANRLWNKMPINIKQDVYNEFKNEFPEFADGGNINSNNMERVKVFIGGYPWWLQKIDSTHLYLSNSENEKGGVYHIGQLFNRDTRTSNQFYTDVEQWLHGKLDITDKQYGEFERGGAFEYATGGGIDDKTIVEFIKSLEEAGIMAKNAHLKSQAVQTIKSIVTKSKEEFADFIKKSPNANVGMIYSEYYDWIQTYAKKADGEDRSWRHEKIRNALNSKKKFTPYDPVYEAEKPGALDFVPEEDRWMEKGGGFSAERQFNPNWYKVKLNGEELEDYRIHKERATWLDNKSKSSYSPIFKNDEISDPFPTLSQAVLEIKKHHQGLAHKFSFSKGGKVSFDELSGNEKQLLEILKKKNNAIIETIERQSSREYDIVYSGTYSPNGIPFNFRAWLPLAAIRDLVEWNTEAVAEMSDHYNMVMHSDWSGIRDTNRASLWDIFNQFVVTKKETGGSVSKQNKLCPVGTEIQTLIFSKETYTQAYAKKWANEHDFKTGVDETTTSYRFRQQEPNNFQKGSFRTIELKPGLKAVIGCPIEKHEQGGELVHPFVLKKIILQYNEVEDYSAAYKQLEKDGYNVAVVQGLELALMVKGSEIGFISISKKGSFDKNFIKN